jgi:hypothetical protein
VHASEPVVRNVEQTQGNAQLLGTGSGSMGPPEVISGRNVAEIMFSEQIVPKRDLFTVPPNRYLTAEQLLLGS